MKIKFDIFFMIRTSRVKYMTLYKRKNDFVFNVQCAKLFSTHRYLFKL